VIVTHALFPPLGLSDDDLRALTEREAWIELSWLMHHSPSPGPGFPPPFARPMVPLARAVDVIRMLGPDRILLSADFGQATNPTPVNGLHDFLSALLAAGVSAGDLRRMVQHNPAQVLGLAPFE
jgi:microsomal dipeptidase-like Zn-dependent dipeptidase